MRNSIQNMINYIFVLVIAVSTACTKIKFEDQKIDVDDLSISSIKTDLEIINFRVNEEAFKSFYNAGNSGQLLPAQMEVYQADKTRVLNDYSVKLKIRGVGSALYDLKSMEIMFENTFDQSIHHFIEDKNSATTHNLSKLQNFRLRNSGQDFYYTFLKDKAFHQLAASVRLNFEVMFGTKSYHIFINGNYHGMLNARSESNLKGISSLIGVPTEQLVIYKVNNSNENIEYHSGNRNITVDLEDAIDNYSPEELYKLIDIPSFIDYLIFEDYAGNYDWLNNNIKMYSVNGKPFRFILYDLDMAIYKTREVYLPRLEYLDFDIAKIYRKCRLINGFDEQLEKRRGEILQLLCTSQFNKIVDEFASQIEDEIIYNIAKYDAPENYLSWMRSVELLKQDFADRDNFVRNFYKN